MIQPALSLFYKRNKRKKNKKEKKLNQKEKKKRKKEKRKEKVRTMTVLFSELLLPGWAQGEDAMIGLNDLTNSELPALPCHMADPEVFFAEDLATIKMAKALCAQCPMRQRCLEGALSRSEPCGVWGGELFDQGRVIQAKRLPGRPSAASLATSIEVTDTPELEAQIA